MSRRSAYEIHLGVGFLDRKSQVDVLNLSLEVTVLIIEPFTGMILDASHGALYAFNWFHVGFMCRWLQRESGNSFFMTFFAVLVNIILQINVSDFVDRITTSTLVSQRAHIRQLLGDGSKVSSAPLVLIGKVNMDIFFVRSAVFASKLIFFLSWLLLVLYKFEILPLISRSGIKLLWNSQAALDQLIWESNWIQLLMEYTLNLRPFGSTHLSSIKHL